MLAGRNWRRVCEGVLDAYGVSEACASPLLMIGRLGEGVRQVTLAEHVGIETASLVRLLDQLCTAGLVRREEDTLDRRAKTLWLTSNGAALTARVEAELHTLRAQVLEGISSADLEATLNVFRAFDKALESKKASPRPPPPVQS